MPDGRFTSDGTAERFVRVHFPLPLEAVRRLAAAREHLGAGPHTAPCVAVA